MSIIIPGMNMPKDGVKHLCVYPDGTIFDTMEFQGPLAKAIELPPHGRLGDLDRLEQMFLDIDHAPYSGFDGQEAFYSAEDAAQIIRLAHTIIPADPAEE